MPFGREQRLMFMRRKECKPPANLTRSEIGVGADPHRALGIAKARAQVRPSAAISLAATAAASCSCRVYSRMLRLPEKKNASEEF